MNQDTVNRIIEGYLSSGSPIIGQMDLKLNSAIVPQISIPFSVCGTLGLKRSQIEEQVTIGIIHELRHYGNIFMHGSKIKYLNLYGACIGRLYLNDSKITSLNIIRSSIGSLFIDEDTSIGSSLFAKSTINEVNSEKKEQPFDLELFLKEEQKQ